MTMRVGIDAEYGAILEQGGFNELNQSELILAAAGRIHAARIRGQNHFDEMEESPRRILADVLTIILYHKTKSE